MNVAVIGTGYVGLVTGLCLAKIGHNVTCVDQDQNKIEALRNGEVPIFEAGLADVMAEVTAANRLHFTTDTAEAVAASDAVVIAVGTPAGADGHASDVSHVLAAARQVAESLQGFTAIIIKSTVPVGTSRKIAEIIHVAAPAADVEVICNPEFLREGAAIFDFMNPDRIIIGARSARGRDVMNQLYAPFIARNIAVLHTEPESAEMTKLASNTLLATKIAFINEIAALCDKTGADVADVARGMGLDHRIGAKFLQAGPGFGGSCFPKDMRALAAMARALDMSLPITEALIVSNENTKQRMIAKIHDVAGGDVRGLTLAIFGVTFKPETDDMREAPALTILPPLIKSGATLHIADPQGRRHGEALFDGARWFDDAYAAAANADVIVVMTEWQLFQGLDLAQLARSMKTPHMADLRNIYAPGALRQAGFTRFCQVGR
jgi:UDPglucose 6-dehydrogenase